MHKSSRYLYLTLMIVLLAILICGCISSTEKKENHIKVRHIEIKKISSGSVEGL